MTTTNDLHIKYMGRCIQLARNAKGFTSPNPLVGSVIVYNDSIIGEGYHVKYGEAHAEVNAIRSVKNEDFLRNATLYVNLEPCSHYGKTPPCADLIIECGIPRVVIGTIDECSLVKGRGIEKLRSAGIEVVVGVMQQECYELNKYFFTLHNLKRPFITLKWAQSSDGYIDGIRIDENAKKLSSSASLCAVHKLRSECDAILVGTRTAILDNPALNVRSWHGKNPIRLVIDKKLVLPQRLKLFDGTIPTVVFTSLGSEMEPLCNVKQIKIDFNNSFLEQLFDFATKNSWQHLLVEGGRELLQSFIDEGAWDEIRVEYSSLVLNQGVPAPILPTNVEVEFLNCFGHKISKYKRTK